MPNSLVCSPPPSPTFPPHLRASVSRSFQASRCTSLFSVSSRALLPIAPPYTPSLCPSCQVTQFVPPRGRDTVDGSSGSPICRNQCPLFNPCSQWVRAGRPHLVALVGGCWSCCLPPAGVDGRTPSFSLNEMRSAEMAAEISSGEMLLWWSDTCRVVFFLAIEIGDMW